MKFRSVASLSVLLLVPLLALQPTTAAGDLPRLVVQITVDQLRGDLPLLYRDRFGAGGFRRFLEHGTWYAAARQPHAQTETIVGHATLATGAYPSRHGLVANVWFDREAGTRVSNIEDERYPPLSVRGEKPTGKGASPLTILTTTFSDELAMATGGRAKIFSVSGKDRGAVPLSGHTGKAFWFSLDNGCFVSSEFYYRQYPSWVKAECARDSANAYAEKSWQLARPPQTYVHRDITNSYREGTPAEANMKTMDDIGFGRTFPHRFAKKGLGLLYRGLTTSPYGDRLTLDFVKTLIREERLGRHEVPDYLAISFSSTDIIAHWFGPASLESEDNMLRLDETLRDLLTFVDREVGLRRTLVVISGDHGGPEYPEYLKERNLGTGRLSPAKILDAAKMAVDDRYGTVAGIIAQVSMPYVYLDRSVIAKSRLDGAEVERTVASALQRLDGVSLALARSDMASGRDGADEELVQRIRRNHHPRRSGDVYVVQAPQWQIDETDNPKLPNLLQHGSPWSYDTHVPVAFTGWGVPAAFVLRAIETVDVAATLSALLGTRYPSGSTGAPLTELSIVSPVSVRPR